MGVFRNIKRTVKNSLDSESSTYKVISGTYRYLSSKKYQLLVEKRNPFVNKEKKEVKKAVRAINEAKRLKKDYIVLYNPEWLGVANSTKGLFESNVPLEETKRKSSRNKIIKAIISSGVKQVIFSQIVDRVDRTNRRLT
jgi:hypothetical protein